MIAISILYHSKVLLASLWIWTKNENSRSVFREIQNGHLHGILPVNSVALMPLECFDSRIRIGCIYLCRSCFAQYTPTFLFDSVFRFVRLSTSLFRFISYGPSCSSFRFVHPNWDAPNEPPNGVHHFRFMHLNWDATYRMQPRAGICGCTEANFDSCTHIGCNFPTKADGKVPIHAPT